MQFLLEEIQDLFFRSTIGRTIVTAGAGTRACTVVIIVAACVAPIMMAVALALAADRLASRGRYLYLAHGWHATFMAAPATRVTRPTVHLVAAVSTVHLPVTDPLRMDVLILPVVIFPILGNIAPHIAPYVAAPVAFRPSPANTGITVVIARRISRISRIAA